MNVNTLAVSHYTENKQSKLNTGSGKYIRSYIINQGRATPGLLAALRKRGEVEHPLCWGGQGLQGPVGGKETGLPVGEQRSAREVSQHGGAGSGRQRCDVGGAAGIKGQDRVHNAAASAPRGCRAPAPAGTPPHPPQPGQRPPLCPPPPQRHGGARWAPPAPHVPGSFPWAAGSSRRTARRRGAVTCWWLLIGANEPLQVPSHQPRERQPLAFWPAPVLACPNEFHSPQLLDGQSTV